MRYFASRLLFAATATLFLIPASADPAFSQSTDLRGSDMQEFAERLSARATFAARMSGRASGAGTIACDTFGIHCTCDGVFACAWLAYGCSEVGGIQGFDGECFLPSRDPETNRAVLDLRLAVMPGSVKSTCDGIFCSCSGGEGSSDCQALSATCIDEVSCVDDSCGCIGGTASE